MPPPEMTSEGSDSRLVRQVRRSLVLWSGGTTLLILVVLGVALYTAVAGSLASSGMAQLDARMNEIRIGRAGPADVSRFGFIFGGQGSGTYALIVGPAGNVVSGPRIQRPPPGLPDEGGITAAAISGRDVRTTSLGGTPVRILTETMQVDRLTFTVQVIGDRTAEQQTLGVMLAVLLTGGLIVVLVGFGFGTVYARRALVPIRESLASQRAALSRQREFAADASHELRTPLTVIRSSIDHLIRHRSEPVERVGSALEDIEAEVRQMTSIVEDLLLLARSDSGAMALERVPVDLGDVVVAGASALSKPAAERGVRVEVDAQPAVLVGDPARLRQLVMILVDNAIRHSPPGGRVGVAVRVDAVGLSLFVDDDGPGIRPDDLPHLFERFYRAAGAPGGGTGLGLAIAKWIAERHGGRIEVVNRVEGGSRFIARLPATGRSEGSSNGFPV